MGTLLFGALLFQMKFKIVLNEHTSNPRMCVAAYLHGVVLLKKEKKKFKMASTLFQLHISRLSELEEFSDEIIYILSLGRWGLEREKKQ